MTPRILGLALLAGTAPLVFLAATPAAAQNVGVTSAVVNDVRMTTQANRTLHKAVVRERVSMGNDVLTGRASRAQILLLDRTSFTIGANARIKIDRFVYDPQRNSSSVGATVGKGAFRFMSGPPTHNARGQSTIRTPTASIGIRGTLVDGVVGPDAIAVALAQPGLPPFDADPETATLIVLRGPGTATADQPIGAIDVTAGGRTVSMEGAGWAVFIPREGAEPIGPFQISPEASRRMTSLLLEPSPDLNNGDVRARGTAVDAPARQLPVAGTAGNDGGVVSTDPLPPPGQNQPGSPVVRPPGADPLAPATIQPRI